MENSTSLQNPGMEQQISHQKEVNEKLLRKYVISQTRSYSGEQYSYFLVCLLLIALGVYANLQFGLKWQVIVAICSTFFIGGLYYLFISLPLTEGSLTITDIANLQSALLRYKKCDLIGTTIFLTIITALFIWLAFELYDIFTERFWKFEIDNRKGIFAAMATIGLTVIMVLLSIVSTYFSSKNIDDLVADIEECKLE